MSDKACIKKDSFRETAEFLFKENYRYIYKVVNVLVQDKDITEDIVQEAFLKAFQNLNRLRDKNSFKPWLTSIALNLCKDHFARTKKEIPVEKIFAPSADLTLEQQVLKIIENADLKKVLDELEFTEKEILMLKYYFELSLKEIAGHYKINVPSTSARLFRARRKFQKIYETNQGGEDIVRSSEARSTN